VIILNYHHLFDREIRDQLYANLNVEEQDVMLLIDEAHNCGDVIQSVESAGLAQKDLEQATRELSGMKRLHKGAEAVQHVLPRLTNSWRAWQIRPNPKTGSIPGYSTVRLSGARSGRIWETLSMNSWVLPRRSGTGTRRPASFARLRSSA